MANVKIKATEVVEIQAIKMREIVVYIVGTTPLIMHRFSEKAKRELLYPSEKKNKSARANSLKHVPIEEYQGCFYRNRDDNAPTLFHLPAGMIHQSMAAAALDVDGATRTAIERLTNIVGQIDLYGIPTLGMDMVRSSDQARTPDVRTRPKFKRWACSAILRYKIHPLNDAQILNLLGAAGQIVGFGDWRTQKGGAGCWGNFRVVQPDDKEYRDIISKEGRGPQQRAYDRPEEFDEDTTELITWFNAEVARRRQAKDEGVPKAARIAKPKGNGHRPAAQ